MVLTQRRITVNEAVVHTELDEESILLNVETGIYFGLNALGTDIWRALAHGADGPEIVAQLTAAYDAPREQLLADLTAFLDQLAARGLISLAGT